MEKAKRRCIYCEKALLGRADKRFCSTACRTAHHNQLHPEKDAEMQQIIKILKKNRRLLKHFSPKGNTTIRKTTLCDLGYDFRYFTNIYLTKKGLTYYICFDYGIRILDSEKCLIINRQAYMAKQTWSPT